MEPETRKGAVLALAAFIFWGLLTPIYFKALAAVPPVEILAHRIIWTLVLAGAIVVANGDWRGLGPLLRDRRSLLLLGLSTLLITINWLAFIAAITSGRALEASLGYYINPLVNVFLGLLLLRERLSRVQSLAVLLAAVGVVNETWQVGVFPFLALTMAFSFGLYGLIRKTARAGAVDGLMLETAILMPVALGYLGFLAVEGQGHFLIGSSRIDLLLALSGPMTALPLIWFAGAARRLRYATIGLFQYIAPTCIFGAAVLLFDEPFSQARLLTFACIWCALVLYTWDSLRRQRQARRRALA